MSDLDFLDYDEEQQDEAIDALLAEYGLDFGGYDYD